MARSPNDITAYRKKQKRNSFFIKLSVFSALLITAALVIINAETIFEPLNGIGSRIESKTSATRGFPVRLPGSAEYSFENFGDNFVLLTDTYLYNYEQSGAQLYAFQHGYGSPVMCAGNSRILLYNHNSFEFALFNRGSRVFDGKTDEKIMGAYLGDGDMSAIVTGSKRYSNVIYVYDRNGKQKFIRKYIDENVTSVDFSNNGEAVIVTTIKSENGENIGLVYKYSLSSEEDALWKYQLPDGAWPLKVNATGNSVNVLGDEMFISLVGASGEMKGAYYYEGRLINAVLEGNLNALVIDDKINNSDLLITLDGGGGIISTKIMNSGLKQVEIYDNLVYTLEGDFIKSYNPSLETTLELPLEEEYDGFIIIGASAYLLGYDLVDKADLFSVPSATQENEGN